MKLLKIENNIGLFLDGSGQYTPVDKISKEDILRLVNFTLDKEAAEFDPYDEDALKHQAHQIVYKSIVEKLRSLKDRRQKFTDESQRLFLSEYEKYRGDSQ